MSQPARTVDVRITWRRDWAPHLFSFGTTRPEGLDFAPGQFVRLGVARADGAMEWRAYSIASAPGRDELGFYSIVVPDGPFTQALVTRRVGDVIQLDPTVYGFLRTDRFTGGRDLWLLATGTGIAPFVAMLEDDAVWSAFARIVLVHGVRTTPEFAYRDAIEGFASRHPETRFVRVESLTGDGDAAIRGRITAALADGRLEAAAGTVLSPADSRLMVVGNPSMIKDVRALLGERGFSPVRRDKPGQFIVENFW